MFLKESCFNSIVNLFKYDFNSSNFPKFKLY